MQKIPVWTGRDFEAQKTWEQFIERITNTGLLFTIEQWQTILAWNITSKTMLLERVTQIIEMKPFIGINDVGLIAMYAGKETTVIKATTGVTWVPKIALGTYENSDDPKLEGATVTYWGTTTMLSTNEMDTFLKFFSLLTDDLRNVPLMGFVHETLPTEFHYLYSCGTTTVTPLPEDVTELTDFRFVKDNHTNAVVAFDKTGRTHTGVLRLTGKVKPQINVIYEAVTNPGTPTTRGANRTSL